MLFTYTAHRPEALEVVFPITQLVLQFQAPSVTKFRSSECIIDCSSFVPTPTLEVYHLMKISPYVYWSQFLQHTLPQTPLNCNSSPVILALSVSTPHFLDLYCEHSYLSQEWNGRRRVFAFLMDYKTCWSGAKRGMKIN